MSRRLSQLKFLLIHLEFLPRRHGLNFPGSAPYPSTTAEEEEEEETSSSMTVTATTTKEAPTPPLLLRYPPHHIATALTATRADYYQLSPSFSSSSFCMISFSLYASLGLFVAYLSAFLASGGGGSAGCRRSRRMQQQRQLIIIQQHCDPNFELYRRH